MKNILLAIALIITIYLLGNDIDQQLASDGNQIPVSLTK